MPAKDERWFANIRWDDTCRECQGKNGGTCTRRYCAEFHYDEWGDKIPNHLYHCDGNGVAEYLEEKRRRMERSQDDFYDDLLMEQKEQM